MLNVSIHVSLWMTLREKEKKIINAMQMNERLHEGQGVENNKNQRESSRVVEQSPVDWTKIVNLDQNDRKKKE